MTEPRRNGTRRWAAMLAALIVGLLVIAVARAGQETTPAAAERTMSPLGGTASPGAATPGASPPVRLYAAHGEASLVPALEGQRPLFILSLGSDARPGQDIQSSGRIRSTSSGSTWPPATRRSWGSPATPTSRSPGTAPARSSRDDAGRPAAAHPDDRAADGHPHRLLDADVVPRHREHGQRHRWADRRHPLPDARLVLTRNFSPGCRHLRGKRRWRSPATGTTSPAGIWAVPGTRGSCCWPPSPSSAPRSHRTRWRRSRGSRPGGARSGRTSPSRPSCSSRSRRARSRRAT